MNEAEFQRAIIEAAKYTGWLVFHAKPAQLGGSWATHFDGDVGFPDLVLAHSDRGLLFAELKTERGKVTPGQRSWLNVLEDSGAEAHLWRPQDWDTIVARLMGE